VLLCIDAVGSSRRQGESWSKCRKRRPDDGSTVLSRMKVGLRVFAESKLKIAPATRIGVIVVESDAARWSMLPKVLNSSEDLVAHVSHTLSSSTRTDTEETGSIDVMPLLKLVGPLLEKGKKFVNVVLFWSRDLAPSLRDDEDDLPRLRWAQKMIAHKNLGFDAVYFHGDDLKVAQTVLNGLGGLDYHCDGSFLAVSNHLLLMKAIGYILSSKGIKRSGRLVSPEKDGNGHSASPASRSENPSRKRARLFPRG